MNEIKMAFFLTTIAGLSTLLGLLPIILKPKNEDRLIVKSLSFASGVMLCISVTDLIPESQKLLAQYIKGPKICLYSLLFIVIGIILSNQIDKKISTLENKNKLYKVGIISTIAIILHNIPEGIATFITTTKNTSLGINLTIAIALHNIPEGITIGIPLYYATKSKKIALKNTLIAALSEPLGAIITYIFLLPFINNYILGILFSLIAGIMIQISLIELLPTSYQYKDLTTANIYFFLGIILMIVNKII